MLKTTLLAIARIAGSFLPLLLLAAPALAQTPALAETPMTWPSPSSLEAHAVNQDWIELVLPEAEYAATVDDPSNYCVMSADDPRFPAAITPALVQHRHFPERAPYTATAGGDLFHIEVVYRVYLKLPISLTEGKHYTVTAPAVVAGGPFSFAFDPAVPNEAIHVNQVAYLATGPKIAYVSAWTGAGSVDFGAATTFDLVNDATQAVAFTGNVHFDVAAASEPLSQSNVYSLDFSSFTGEGSFHLHVPTVGSSFGFRVTKGAFRTIGYTVFRGLTLQRDGDHGLTSAVTRWWRPAAHVDDAIVESTGQRADLTGGHMDAGDRGKYPYHTADASAALLSAIQLFPDEVEAFGESMQIRESSNGVPDLLDEAVYELDFLRKVVMNTPGDGTLPFFLRAQNYDGSGGYELLAPIEGKANRKLYDVSMGPNRAETLYAAGALAMAYNTPLLQKYLPAKCTAYLLAAERAFSGFEAHNSSPSYFREQGWYDAWTAGAHPWSDEMLTAAANLYEATGDAKYLAWIKSELPANLGAVRRWGWSLGGPWLPAFVSLSRVTRSGLEAAIPGVHQRLLAGITNWADAALGSGATLFNATFGAPIPWNIFTQVGWYFTGQQTAYPLMVGYGVTRDERYRAALVKTWSYLLGTNPLSRSFVSGLGNPRRRPRWMVHEIALGQWRTLASGDPSGWSEVSPGFPSADVQSGQYDSVTVHEAWNLSRRDHVSPALNTYPVLYRYHDSWTVSDEVTIDVIARQAASIAPLLGTATSVNACFLVQRGTNGAVADAQIAEDQPTSNLGSGSSASVSGVVGSSHQALLQFDLSSFPVDASLEAATLTLLTTSGAPSELDAHLITAPWTEGAVTWSSFGQSFARSVASSATTPASFTGSTSLDVTALATSWISGSNFGLVLTQPGASSRAITTSEAALASARPALSVCYSRASFSDSFSLPNGQVIDSSPGGRWLGRYGVGRPSAIADSGHARLVDWGTLTTAQGFHILNNRSLHFGVRLFGGQPETVKLLCKTAGYYGVLATYDGAGTLSVSSNNLGYAPQRHDSSFAVSPEADGSVVVDMYLTGAASEVQVTDAEGAQLVGPQSNDRLDSTCQSAGFEVVLGYFGVYDDVLVEQVSAVP